MPPTNEVCVVRGLYPFMIAASASYKESPLSVVFVLLRQVPSQIHNCNSNSVCAVGNAGADLSAQSRPGIALPRKRKLINILKTEYTTPKNEINIIRFTFLVIISLCGINRLIFAQGCRNEYYKPTMIVLKNVCSTTKWTSVS